MAREDFQKALQEEMQRGFKDLAVKARKKLGQLIDSPIDGVAFGACKEVLNKAGYIETQKIEQRIDSVIKVDVIDD